MTQQRVAFPFASSETLASCQVCVCVCVCLCVRVVCVCSCLDLQHTKQKEGGQKLRGRFTCAALSFSSKRKKTLLHFVLLFSKNNFMCRSQRLPPQKNPTSQYNSRYPPKNKSNKHKEEACRAVVCLVVCLMGGANQQRFLPSWLAGLTSPSSPPSFFHTVDLHNKRE